jgi:hypothetical protein
LLVQQPRYIIDSHGKFKFTNSRIHKTKTAIACGLHISNSKKRKPGQNVFMLLDKPSHQ